MIKIPENIQLGFKAKSIKAMKLVEGEYPLAFCRRYDEDKSTAAMTETIKKWCGFEGKKSFKPIVLFNEPMHGFKFGDCVKRYITDNKVFEVHDPRGFTLQIQAANLAILIGSATIEKGEIKSECVWAFDNGNPVLLDVNSPYYEEALKVETEEKERKDGLKRVTMKNLHVGNVYQTKRGDKYYYFGKCTLKVDVMTNRHIFDEHESDKLHVFISAPKVFQRRGATYGTNIYETINVHPRKSISGMFLAEPDAGMSLEETLRVINGYMIEKKDKINRDNMKYRPVVENEKCLVPDRWRYLSLIRINPVEKK